MLYLGPLPSLIIPPIEPQYFQPWSFYISNITLGVTTTVTVIVPVVTQLNYVVGQQVRLLVPQQSGCRQINRKTGYILSVSLPNQVVIDINSLGSDPFISQSTPNQPQISAIGDINSGALNSAGNLSTSVSIQGSFQNISPN